MDNVFAGSMNTFCEINFKYMNFQALKNTRIKDNSLALINRIRSLKQNIEKKNI